MSIGVRGRASRIRFDAFEFDHESGELFKAGSRIPIQEQPLVVLRALLERPGGVVTCEELTLTAGVVLTRHLLFPPFPSEIPILTDGPRIYFPEFVSGRHVARQVSAAGGEPLPVPVSIADHHVSAAVSPDGLQLLVAAFDARGASSLSDVPLWIVSTAGGAPRRIPDVEAHGATWLKDGRILFTFENRFFLVDPDDSGRRELFAIPGRAYWPRVSPDGRRIRFTLFVERRPVRCSCWSS